MAETTAEEASLRRRQAKKEALTTLRDALRYLRSDEVGMAARADDVQTRATQPSGAPVVLVLGEPGSGKSSLVQLLAPHEISDEPALDGVYCTVRPPLDEGDRELRWVDPEGALLTGPEGAVGAVVPWRQCVLGPTVTVVDTPCIGGIQGAQARVSRSLAMGASAAVFVTDAGAPLSAPELDYLEHLLAPIQSLVVVVTKTDLYPGSWREVVETNRELLASRSGRSARGAGDRHLQPTRRARGSDE